MKVFGIVVLFLVLLNCSTHKEDKGVDTDRVGTIMQPKSDSGPISDIDYFNIQSYLTLDSIIRDDLTIVDEDCAILVYPTEEQLDRMEKKYGSDDFYIIADDASYYQGMAIGLLDSLKVKTISAKKPFTRFVGTTKKYTIHIRKEGFPEWNLFLFKKDKEPVVIGTVGLNAEVIKGYFRNGR
ncbi:MAG: hypothetical protein ACK5RG_19660 [Cyclobacteriaceae bacterium]|jgi:hypothetical protein|nr:hypothetical protein [Flammeovirgaceae bacterium]